MKRPRIGLRMGMVDPAPRLHQSDFVNVWCRKNLVLSAVSSELPSVVQRSCPALEWVLCRERPNRPLVENLAAAVRSAEPAIHAVRSMTTVERTVVRDKSDFQDMRRVGEIHILSVLKLGPNHPASTTLFQARTSLFLAVFLNSGASFPELRPLTGHRRTLCAVRVPLAAYHL